MTDRFHSLTVVLDKERRDDDAESLIQAILHLRGVISVTGNVANIDFYTAREQAKYELQTQIREVLWPKY